MEWAMLARPLPREFNWGAERVQLQAGIHRYVLAACDVVQ